MGAESVEGVESGQESLTFLVSTLPEAVSFLKGLFKL